MDPLTAGLQLAAAVLGLIPEPDLERRRARYVRRLTALVARLEARDRLSPLQLGRLEGARAALQQLRLPAGGGS